MNYITYARRCKNCGKYLKNGKCDCGFETYASVAKSKPILQQATKECCKCACSDRLKLIDISTKNGVKTKLMCYDCRERYWANEMIRQYPFLKTSKNSAAQHIRSILNL